MAIQLVFADLTKKEGMLEEGETRIFGLYTGLSFGFVSCSRLLIACNQ